MCLAKAYVRPLAEPEAAPTATGSVEGSGVLVMENVTQVDVNGSDIRLRSLLGDAQTLQGHVTSIDFAEGKLVIRSAA